MKTNNSFSVVNINAANVASINTKAAKIEDFGEKIGGARKDLAQEAREWAARVEGVTAETLAAVNLSKVATLPALDKLVTVGAINADQARGVWVIWRSIDKKPARYGVKRWTEETAGKLSACVSIMKGAEVPEKVQESAEFRVLTAANWPAVPFSFGRYSVAYRRTWGVVSSELAIIGGRYYQGTSSDPAEIVAKLRELIEKDADRRAAGPELAVYINRAGVYFIAPKGKPEICLKSFENRNEAFKAAHENRPELVERYRDLMTVPECRREWNRPRVGEDWRNDENVTPEKFAAVLPFRGVEFGNWVNQTERAALLNSAFDGFHDLAAVLNIAPAAVTLNGSLAFAFASRGHSKASAHYEPSRQVINLTKKNGAGCMAHEWFHAVDDFAAVGCFATVSREDTPAAIAARAIVSAIRKTSFFVRSCNLAKFKGEYWTKPEELAARGFEGVIMVLLNAAGICSDFLANVLSFDEFTAADAAHRSDLYPYPTATEAAELIPYYIEFFRAVFGDGVKISEAAQKVAAEASEKAEAEREEAARIRQERAEAAEKERKEKAAAAAKAAEEAAEKMRQAAALTVETVREVLSARHFDAIATGYDSASVYAVAHLEGEIYTMSADIEKTNAEGRAYVETRPAARVDYKRAHNAKRIILHSWKAAQIRASKWNARELVESLADEAAEVRTIARAFASFEKVETWNYSEKIWNDTQKLNAYLSARKREKVESGTTAHNGEENTTEATNKPADGLQLVEIDGGVAVVGDSRTTYKNRREIKSHGATWNKTAQRWEGTTPEAVADLRSWFGVDDVSTEQESEELTTIAEELQKMGFKQSTGEEKPARACLYTITDKKRSPELSTTFADMPTAQKWLEDAINGTGALSIDAIDVLSVNPFWAVYYSKRNGEFICLFLLSEVEKPEYHAADMRGRLIEARRSRLTEQFAADIVETVESHTAAAYVMQAKDTAQNIIVTSDAANTGRYRVIWALGDTITESIGNRTSEDAAEDVAYFFDAYDGIVNRNTPESKETAFKVGDRVLHRQTGQVATVTEVSQYDGKTFEEQPVFTLDFGRSVKGPHGIELNGGVFLVDALRPFDTTTDYTPNEFFALRTCCEVEDSNAEEIKQQYAERIAEAAQNGLSHVIKHKKKSITAQVAYKNDPNDIETWMYVVCWYYNGNLVECENGISLEQAAKHFAHFAQMAKKGWKLCEILYGKKTA